MDTLLDDLADDKLDKPAGYSISRETELSCLDVHKFYRITKFPRFFFTCYAKRKAMEF